MLRVHGYYCATKAEVLAFLAEQAKGENEEMAANAVNKSVGKLSCAYYTPADALPAERKSAMSDGLVFQLQSHVFLPENVERWTGSVFGSLQPANLEHDI